MSLSLNRRVRELGKELGALGMLSLGVIAITALFVNLVLQPMQDKNRRIESSIAKHARQVSPDQGGSASVGEKLAGLYKFLERSEAPTDWLAKLYGIGKATGVELQSANYRTPQASGRVERYEIVLPVAGNYLQIREFLNRALAEIPVLSLDQMTLRRESRNDGAVQAELRLTLHKVKP
jgi:Tfp pilus assembly protein PilO